MMTSPHNLDGLANTRWGWQAFEPHPRRAFRSSQPAKEDGPLDKFNNVQTERFLHPTKGRRRVSVRRSRAALITDKIKAGEHWRMDQIKDFLNGDRVHA